MKTIAALILLCLMASPVQSQHWDDDERYRVRKQVYSSCDWWGNCRRYYRPRVQGWYSTGNHHHLDSRNLERCKPSIRVWGDQAQTIENAKARAITSFTGATRFQFGEVYLDFSLAEDVKILCSPSSVSDTITSKIQEKVFNTEYFRCEVQARPCRPKRKED